MELQVQAPSEWSVTVEDWEDMRWSKGSSKKLCIILICRIKWIFRLVSTVCLVYFSSRFWILCQKERRVFFRRTAVGGAMLWLHLLEVWTCTGVFVCVFATKLPWKSSHANESCYQQPVHELTDVLLISNRPTLGTIEHNLWIQFGHPNGILLSAELWKRALVRSASFCIVWKTQPKLSFQELWKETMHVILRPFRGMQRRSWRTSWTERGFSAVN